MTYTLPEGATIGTFAADTLPTSFCAPADAVVTYKIYGTSAGAGVETENLLPYVNGTYTNNRMTITCHNGHYVVDVAEGTGGSIYTIPLPEFNVPVCQAQGGNGALLMFNTTANYSMNVTLKNGSVAITSNIAIAPVNKVVTNYSSSTSEATCNGVQIYCGNTTSSAHMEFSLMIIDETILPDHYIPHGYKLPLTVESGAQSQDVPIYIGSTKLGAEEYLDYAEQKIYKMSEGTLVPTDPPVPFPPISTYEGENTLSSTETLGDIELTGDWLAIMGSTEAESIDISFTVDAEEYIAFVTVDDGPSTQVSDTITMPSSADSFTLDVVAWGRERYTDTVYNALS